MEFKEDPENNVPRSGSFSGAIFMCNRSTKKECLQRKLFGLPPPQINFVEKVKVGMILFLFEYEERKLYGVFQASSDGAMNIVPQAFNSTGKQIPAQIRIKKIWNCLPLFEPDFRDALRDNYYTPKKFHYGLSEDQVQKLLLLFSTRKLYQRQQNPMAHVKARKWKAKSGLGRVRVTNEGRCLTKNSAETVVGMHNGTRNLTKYPELPGSGLKNREEDQHRLSDVAPHSMQPRIPKFCSTSQDNQHVAIPSGNSYFYRDPSFLSRLPSPFGMDHNAPAKVHAPVDSLFQHFRGQVVPSHSEPQNLIKFSARQHLDVACNLGDYIPLDCQDIPSQVHASADSLLQHFGGQLITSHVEPENLNGSTARHNQDVANNLGDYIPLSCDDDFKPSSTGIILPETDYFLNKSIDYNDFKGYNRLSFHEPPLATMPFSRNKNYGRENCEGMQHWKYEPSTAAMSVSSERKFHPHVSVHPLDSRGVEPVGVTDHNDYRGHSGRQYDTQNTRTNYRHEEYGDQFGLHHDSQNARTSDCKYYRDPFGMYCDIQRASVFSRLAMPQETIMGDDDDEYMDEGDMMDLSVDQLLELLHQNQNRWRQSTKRLQRFIVHCNDDNNQLKKIRGLEMSEDAVLVNEEDKSRERGTEDVMLVNFKRRSEVRKARDETVGGSAKGADNESLSGTPGKRRKLRRPSFGTIITEEGKENGKQSREEIFLESKTIQADASIGEADDWVKPKNQSREMGSNATTAVSFGTGDSVTETEPEELLPPPPSTCETKEQ